MVERTDTSRILAVVAVDDDASHLQLIRRTLMAAFERDPRELVVQCHQCPERALAELPVAAEVVILMDYRLGGTTGIQWLPDFVREDVGPVLMVTSSGDESVAAEAFRDGASDYVNKDELIQDPERARRSIVEALRRYRIERTNRDLRRRLKQANQELERKNERLGALTDTAHRFVDDVAHEFRTPLAVIKEFAAIIDDGLGGDVTAAQHEYLAFIRTASQDLADLVDDFLDSGKLQARTLRVTRRRYDIREILEEVRPLLESRARARGVPIEFDVAADAGSIFVDEEKLRRILVNLVVNALKFSSADAPVVVEAAPVADGRVRLGVRDQGPGMSPEECESLFERFRQGGEAWRVESRGFGLGLNIVRSLAEVNLARVAVESELGAGSCFTVDVPRFDVPAIVDAFIEMSGRRHGKGTLSLYRVEPPTPAADGEHGLEDFVASVCHPHDLILPTADGRGVHVVLETGEPEAWRRRLLAEASRDPEWAAANEGGPPLDAVHLGSWFVGAARAPLVDLLRTPTELARAS